MKALMNPAIIAAIILMIIGAISRFLAIPIIVASRVYAGGAALLLLLAIAIGIQELIKK